MVGETADHDPCKDSQGTPLRPPLQGDTISHAVERVSEALRGGGTQSAKTLRGFSEGALLSQGVTIADCRLSCAGVGLEFGKQATAGRPAEEWHFEDAKKNERHRHWGQGGSQTPIYRVRWKLQSWRSGQRQRGRQEHARWLDLGALYL